MLFKNLAIALLISSSAVANSNPTQTIANEVLSGFKEVASATPYSKSIQRIYLGLDQDGQPRVGIAFRKFESVETITGIVIVEKTAHGYLLREVRFPDIEKIQNTTERAQITSILKKFRGVPFDPYAEKSAVDGLTGATQHVSKIEGYLNYMARRIALDMEERPDWTRPEEK